MRNAGVLRAVNPILGILLVSQVTTGLLHDMPTHKAFEVLHGGGGIALAVVAAIHLARNWSWVKANLLQKPSAIKA